MASILGEIQLGTFELGSLGGAVTSEGFTGTASPTLALTTVGGTPVAVWSSVLGTIQLGALELGQIPILPVNGNSIRGGAFVATSDALAVFTPAPQPGSFTGTAQPLASFTPGEIVFKADPLAVFTGRNDIYTSGSFTATAQALATFTPLQPPGFLGVAHPILTIYPAIGQTERCASGTGASGGGIGGNVAF